MSIIESLTSKEKLHYKTLEKLYLMSIGENIQLSVLIADIEETISDWDKMMGGGSNLHFYTETYLKDIYINNHKRALELYLLLSPIVFYINALYELSRKSWRHAVTLCGIFCERICRNLLLQIDKYYGRNMYDELKEAKFENKNGRIKSELESKRFELADDLYSILKRIYFVRNRTGPHDVPPPESIKARITITECLPAYIDYLDALSFLGNDFGDGYNNFLTFFSTLTDTRVSLIFQDDVTKISPSQIIRDFLFKEGFFDQEKSLSDIKREMKNRRFNFSDQSISNTLTKFAKGKNAFLTRIGKRGSYKYVERVPPSQYFTKTI